MIHESKIAFTRVDDNGNDKVIKERYLIAEAESLMPKNKPTISARAKQVLMSLMSSGRKSRKS